MSCGCGSNNCGGECDSQANFESVKLSAQVYPQANPTNTGNCTSTDGKMYDTLTEDFTIPDVGSSAFVRVCNGFRWASGQWMAISIGGGQIAAFRVTQALGRRVRVINGCSSSPTDGIIGNPPPGRVIKTGATIYAIGPQDCETDSGERLAEQIEQYGIQAVQSVLARSENICFTNVPEQGEDEETHLFGGLKPDCDCAPGSLISSCLRKILRIFTGQGGRTLCMPDVATIGLGTPEQDRRFALYDENGCLKKGPNATDVNSCGSMTSVALDAPFDAVIVCKNGQQQVIPAPSSEDYTIVSQKQGGDVDPDIVKWFVKRKNTEYAVIQHRTASGVQGGSTVSGSWQQRPLTNIVHSTDSFVALADNKFTIQKSGTFMIRWWACFYQSNDSQTKLVNTADSSEAYYSNQQTNSTGQSGMTHGVAIVTIANGSNKQFEMQYQVATAAAGQGLGPPQAFGVPNIFASVDILKIL